MEITVSQNARTTKDHRTGTKSLSNSSQRSPFSSSLPPSAIPPISASHTWHKHIHLYGFSDRTVMALHKQIVAMQKHLGNTDISR